MNSLENQDQCDDYLIHTFWVVVYELNIEMLYSFMLSLQKCLPYYSVLNFVLNISTSVLKIPRDSILMPAFI